MSNGDSWADKLPAVKQLVATGQFDEVVAASPFVQKLLERIAALERTVSDGNGTLKQVVAHLQGGAAASPPAAGTGAGTPEALGTEILKSILPAIFQGARPAAEHNPLLDFLNTLKLWDDVNDRRMDRMLKMARLVKGEPGGPPEPEPAPAAAGRIPMHVHPTE